MRIAQDLDGLQRRILAWGCFFQPFMPGQISNAINGMKSLLKLSNSSLDREKFKIAFEFFLNFKILNYF